MLSPHPFFSLPSFSGPLELLLCLVYKEELNIKTILLKEITAQFLERKELFSDLNISAEFIGHLSSLLLTKSRKMLPTHQLESSEESEELSYELMLSLLEYCHYKTIASHLSALEEKAHSCFCRPVQERKSQSGSCLQAVELEDLKKVFEDLMARVQSRTALLPLQEKNWDIAERMAYIRSTIAKSGSCTFHSLFSPDHERSYLITTFLALLELMKLQEVKIYKIEEELRIRRYDVTDSRIA